MVLLSQKTLDSSNGRMAGFCHKVFTDQRQDGSLWTERLMMSFKKDAFSEGCHPPWRFFLIQNKSGQSVPSA
jgi:hypothetical protein